MITILSKNPSQDAISDVCKGIYDNVSIPTGSSSICYAEYLLDTAPNEYKCVVCVLKAKGNTYVIIQGIHNNSTRSYNVVYQKKI